MIALLSPRERSVPSPDYEAYGLPPPTNEGSYGVNELTRIVFNYAPSTQQVDALIRAHQELEKKGIQTDLYATTAWLTLEGGERGVPHLYAINNHGDDTISTVSEYTNTDRSGDLQIAGIQPFDFMNAYNLRKLVKDVIGSDTTTLTNVANSILSNSQWIIKQTQWSYVNSPYTKLLSCYLDPKSRSLYRPVDLGKIASSRAEYKYKELNFHTNIVLKDPRIALIGNTEAISRSLIPALQDPNKVVYGYIEKIKRQILSNMMQATYYRRHALVNAQAS
ncbi:MAG: hypothetical protein WCO06_04545 [Candidatus Roizmanbacteria bacterium]